MNLESIVVRARAQATVFRLVDYALTVEALKERGIPTMPACFVMPVSDSPSPNTLATGAHHQKTTWTWRGYIYVKSARQDFGKGVTDELTPLREALRAAWMGWQPTGADGTTNCGPGRIVGLESGVLIWQDDYYVTSYYRRLAS